MRVVIVSRHPLCREALAALSAQELQPEAVEAVADLDQVRGEPADLLLLDLPLSEDPRAWIAAAPAAVRQVLVVPERDIGLARLAHAAGFKGLLPKTADHGLMAAILKLILAGGEYFPCFEEAAPPEPAVGPAIVIEQLSPRQREVLAELAQGRTNKEIAKALGISIATVKLHVQAILSATGARNRTEVVSRLAEGDRPGRS